MARDFPGGGSDYLSPGDPAALQITGTALSISVWFWRDTAPGAGIFPGIVVKGDVASTTLRSYEMYLSQITADFTVGISDGSGSVDAKSHSVIPTANAWHHGGLVKNGTGAGALACFLDSSKETVTSNLSIATVALPVRIGAWSNTTIQAFDGRIAEVGIWDVALSDAEMAALAKGVSPLVIRPANLRGYWPVYGVVSPEPDLDDASNDATVTGTLNAVNHAPVGPPVIGMAA